MHAEKCPVCDGKGEKHCCDNKGWIEVSDSDKQKEFIPMPYPVYPMQPGDIYPYWEVRPWELPTYTTGGNTIKADMSNLIPTEPIPSYSGGSELFYTGSDIQTQSEIIFQ